MSVQDLQLTCSIRRVFARHWIDSDRLLCTARRGHVHLSGEIKVLGATKGDQGTTVVALQALDAELRNQPGVKSVRFDLTNWVRDESGLWVCVEKETESPPTSPKSRVAEAEIVTLSESAGS